MGIRVNPGSSADRRRYAAYGSVVPDGKRYVYVYDFQRAFPTRGRRLYFLGRDRKVMEVAIDASEGQLSAGSPRTVVQTHVVAPSFAHFQFDVLPDGGFVNSLTAGAPLTIVTGWPELLNVTIVDRGSSINGSAIDDFRFNRRSEIRLSPIDIRQSVNRRSTIDDPQSIRFAVA